MKSCPTCRTDYPTDLAVCPSDGAPLLDRREWPEGVVIGGKYRILEKIAQGELGDVYKAVRPGSDVPLALKVLSAALMDDELLVQRFKEEANRARDFLHPNAVHVETVEDSDDGRPFIVMEYVHGRSLREVLEKESRLPVPRACSIVRQVASALDAAHRFGIVHQDLKPQTIMIVSGEWPPDPVTVIEEVKVLNLGIARIKEERRRDMSRVTLKQNRALMGTPEYFSPEQVLGKRGDELDGRSDLYSIGVLMVQMLSGSLPFKDFPAFKPDSEMDTLLAHLLTTPRPLSQLHTGVPVPEGLASLVMKMLEKKRASRPPNARAVIEELERWEKSGTRYQGLRVSEDQKAEGRKQKAVDGEPVAQVVLAPDAAAQQAAGEPLASACGPQTHAAQNEESRSQKPGSSEGRQLITDHRPPDRQPIANHQKPSSRAPTPDSRPRTETMSMLGLGAAQRPPVAKPSRWRIAVLASIVVISLGGSVLYLPVLRSTFLRLMHSASKPDTSKSPATPNAGLEFESAGSASPGTRSNGSSRSAGATPQATTLPGGRPSAIPQAPPASAHRQPISLSNGASGGTAKSGSASTPQARSGPAPAAPGKVESALATGDRLYELGDYDRAIAAYGSGLKLDPTNKQLRTKIERARAAKAAEARVLNP